MTALDQLRRASPDACPGPPPAPLLAASPPELATERSRPTGRVRRALAEEVAQFRCSLVVGTWTSRLLPSGTGARTRTAILRSVGVEIGHGTTIAGSFELVGHTDPRPNFSIGEHGFVNAGCQIDASAPVTIGDHVAIAQGVLIITNTHAVGPRGRRAAELAPSPVVVGNGCWVGARVTILPGVRIGDGAVIAAGAVVTDDVPSDTLVAGVPARVIRNLDPFGERSGRDAAPDVRGGSAVAG